MAEIFDLIYRPVTNKSFSNFIYSFGGCNLKEGGWVAGGSVRKVWFGLDWKNQDVDWFFPNKKEFDKFDLSLKTLARSNASLGTQDITNFDSLDIFAKELADLPPYCYSTDNADTWTKEGKDKWKIQAIKKYYPKNLQELFESFDFTVCQFATDGTHMVATKEAIEDCEKKTLNVIKNTTRNITPLRITKYAAYGFTPSNDMMKDVIESLRTNNRAMIGSIDDY